MIRMVQSSSPGHAKAYFSEALSKSDYYINDQELQGSIEGKLAERLGIKGAATKETFHLLCENINPVTGKSLTPKTRDDRITGYDINFHCPKSLSVLHVLAKENDNHILEAFEKSVLETMKDIEEDSKTRVRKDGVYDDRNTGELVYAKFVHQTARPVEDKNPDPHLHAHCFVFNATFDSEENKIKAAKFRDVKRDMPFYQARFHKRLSDNLIELGYQIKQTDQSFEIEGVPKQVIDHFSKRTDEIGRFAKEKGISDAKALDGIGARTRSKKQKGLSMNDLKAEWKEQMKAIGGDTPTEKLKPLRFAPIKDKQHITDKDCVDFAMNHCFERASVMNNRRLFEKAYRYSIGDKDISLGAVTEKFNNDDRLIYIKQGSQTMCTTKEVLTEEKRMVEMARKGKGSMSPLYVSVPEIDLDEQQAAAVTHVLTTTDRVSIIRGAAGTGKTTLMKEAVKHIEKAGKKVIVVAPTSQASRGVLKEEGFKNADTVAKLLVDIKLQEQMKDQVLWVDEAGLLGTADMASIIELATKQNAKVILGGDTKQHTSVVRGDALRILNTVGKIQTAEVTKIYRQQNFPYRSAVENLSKGDIKTAFTKLDEMGAIKTVDPLKPHDDLVEDYMKALEKKKTALIISPTHKQGEEVTEKIRKRLKEAGKIGKKELVASKLTNRNLTEAEKTNWRNFQPGQIIQFNQNTKGIKRGSVWTIKELENNQVIIIDEKGNTLPLPHQKGSLFDVYDKSKIGISKGDAVRITRNAFDKNDTRINNGTTLEVHSIDQNGDIILSKKSGKSRFVMDKEFGHIAHDYCVTSHSSQGKTVDEVFIAQPSSTFSATDMKQFYVSVSRGRDKVNIYTDDREALLDYASEIGDRQSALELVSNKRTSPEYVIDQNRNPYQQPNKERANEVVKLFNKQFLEKDYEPGL